MDIDSGAILCLLVNPTYPRISWLMNPFIEHLGSGIELFTYNLNSCGVAVECYNGIIIEHR